MAGHVGARKRASLKAVFGGLLLGFGGKISGRDELVDEGLVLTDAVAEHAAVVAVVIDAPLDIDDLASRVGDHGRVAPFCGWLVVVDADSGVVSARATPARSSYIQVWPRGNRLQDGAFRAGIDPGLLTFSISTAQW